MDDRATEARRGGHNTTKISDLTELWTGIRKGPCGKSLSAVREPSAGSAYFKKCLAASACFNSTRVKGPLR